MFFHVKLQSGKKKPTTENRFVDKFELVVC